MDSSYPYSTTSSSSLSSAHHYHFSSLGRTDLRPKRQPSYVAALHSIRRPLQPKPMMKQPIAPLPPTRPKIYKVESNDFKQVVQKLTSVPEFQPRRLQDIAPPPLNLTTFPADKMRAPVSKSPLSNTFRDLLSETLVTKPSMLSDNYGILSSPFSLSPASLAWCSFLLESPGTMSTLERATVL